MPIRILATADIHMGRRPSKVTDPTDSQRFSCSRMWESIVERAIAENVDLVALSGDVVDHANRFFEATGPLERGLSRLAEHEIPTYAVSGNHDFDVLPRLVDLIGSKHFHLLGQNGHWEESLFNRADGRQLRILGWSFPAEHVGSSPMVGCKPSPDDDVPTLGLLHADLDATKSRYAPVTRTELESQDLNLWLIGHAHSPTYQAPRSGPAILRPGTPQAMDPDEIGPHGPWLIEIDSPRNVTATMLPMSKVRYEPLPVDLSDVETEESFEARLSVTVRERLQRVACEKIGPLKLLLLRAELLGRTRFCVQAARYDPARLEQFERTIGSLTTRIEAIVNQTRPAVDLDALARKSDPPGVLSRMLLKLESGVLDDESRQLIESACEKMRQVHQASAYIRIDDSPAPDANTARQYLIDQGMLLLEALRSQQPTDKALRAQERAE